MTYSPKSVETRRPVMFSLGIVLAKYDSLLPFVKGDGCGCIFSRIRAKKKWQTLSSFLWVLISLKRIIRESKSFLAQVIGRGV